MRATQIWYVKSSNNTILPVWPSKNLNVPAMDFEFEMIAADTLLAYYHDYIVSGVITQQWINMKLMMIMMISIIQ